MSNAIQGFPRDLLHKRPLDRVNYFESYRMKHPFAELAVRRFLDAIYDLESNSIIIFIGPTGVGKTTAGIEVASQITRTLMPDLTADPGRFPFVFYECESQHGSSYYWPGHYRGLLVSMQEPMVDRKRWPEYPKRMAAEFMPDSRAPGPAYQPALISALLERRPKIVFLDEAQHMTKISSGQTYADHLDVVKSIGNRGKSIQGLLGTYGLRHFAWLTAQLGRRARVIHYSRYHANIPEERKIFINVLRTYQQYLPVSKVPELAHYWMYFHERSIGCVGTLKDWLSETLRAVYRRESGCDLLEHCDSTKSYGVITLEDLEAKAPDLKVAKKMWEEADQGEADLRPLLPEIQTQHRKELGLDELDESGERPGSEDNHHQENTNMPAKGNRKRGKNAKPFKQKPARHKLADVDDVGSTGSDI